MGFTFHPNIPYYYQIKEDLQKKIKSSQYQIGDQLPPEQQLAQDYGVSRPTIRQAVVDLVRDGFLVRGRGKGTFVSEPIITSNAQIFTTFAETMSLKGVEQHARLIEAKKIEANEMIAKDLKIGIGEEVYEIIRLRMGNQEPLVLRTMQITAKLCPGLLKEDLVSEPLYTLFKRKYGLVPVNAIQSFRAAASTKEVADLLGILVGAPVMHWQGIVYNAKGEPIERVKSIHRGDRFNFFIQQGRNVDSITENNEIGVGILDGVKGDIW